MKNKKINLIKFGILFFGILITLQNCETEEYDISSISLDEKNLETVQFKEAKYFFNQQEKLMAKTENSLALTPIWETIEHKDLFQINQAQLTTSSVIINRNGNYESELFFIKINNEIHQAIYTIYKEKEDENGFATDALVFLNEIDGTFIDGYRIKDGLFT